MEAAKRGGDASAGGVGAGCGRLRCAARRPGGDAKRELQHECSGGEAAGDGQVDGGDARVAAYAAGLDADGGDRNMRCAAGAVCAAAGGEPGDGDAARADAVGAQRRELPVPSKSAKRWRHEDGSDEEMFLPRPKSKTHQLQQGIFEHVSEHIRREPAQSTRLLEAWIGSSEERS